MRYSSGLSTYCSGSACAPLVGRCAAVDQQRPVIDHSTPGPARDRREMAARLERGFLAAAAEGHQSRESAADLAQAARRAEQLGFPQGAWSLAYARLVESLLRIEAGRLDRAGALAADLREQAERHGFDQWQLAGANQEATVSALAALGADDVDQTALAAHIATITTLLDTFRTLEVNMFSTFYDAVLGRLLIAASQPEQARARLDTGLQLAEDTGMHFYDAELLRLRAHTHTDPEARRADLGAALDLARRQGATLFELHTALDDFELRGEPARVAVVDAVGPFPADSELPELARARASLLKRSPRICDRPRRHALQQGVEP